MGVLFAMISLKGIRTNAIVFILDHFANSLILARCRGARCLLAVLTGISRETVASVMGAFSHAKPLILTRVLLHARMNVFLAILTGKTYFTSAFIIVSANVRADRVVSARFFGRTRANIFLAILSIETERAFAFVIRASNVSACSAILTWLLSGTWTNVSLAIGSFETRFASAGISAAFVVAGGPVFARIGFGARTDVVFAVFACKSGLAFALVIGAIVDASGTVFTGLFSTRSLVYLAIFALESKGTLAFITG